MSQSESNKITVAESEKLKELVNTVKSIEAASEEAKAGGGTPIADETLERARRAVGSYTRYLEEKYDEPAETFITNLETNAKEEPAASGITAENKEVKSPSNVEGNK